MGEGQRHAVKAVCKDEGLAVIDETRHRVAGTHEFIALHVFFHTYLPF